MINYEPENTKETFNHNKVEKNNDILHYVLSSRTRADVNWDSTIHVGEEQWDI